MQKYPSAAVGFKALSMNQFHERKEVVMIINKKIVASMEVPTLRQTINCLIYSYKGKGIFTDEEAQPFIDFLQQFKHYCISLGLSDRVDLQEILFKRCTQAQFELIVDEKLYILGAIDQLVIEKLGWGVALECLDKGVIGCIDLSSYKFIKQLENSEESIDWYRLDLSGVEQLILDFATHVPMKLIAKALEAGVRKINLWFVDLAGLDALVYWDQLDSSGIDLDLYCAKHVLTELLYIVRN